MEIQVTPTEFRHIKATVCLRLLYFFAIHFEYIRLMKKSEKGSEMMAQLCSLCRHHINAS